MRAGMCIYVSERDRLANTRRVPTISTQSLCNRVHGDLLKRIIIYLLSVAFSFSILRN